MNKGSQGLAPYQASLNGARLFDQLRKKQDANGLLRCKQLAQSCKDSDYADLQSKSLRLHLWRVSRSCTLSSKLERRKTFRPWHLDSYSKRSIMGLYGKGRCIGCIGSFLLLCDEPSVDSSLHKFRILEVYKVKFQNGEYYEKCRNLRLDVIK